MKDLSELCEEVKKKGIEFALRERKIRPGVNIPMVKDQDGNSDSEKRIRSRVEGGKG